MFKQSSNTGVGVVNPTMSGLNFSISLFMSLIEYPKFSASNILIIQLSIFFRQAPI